MKEPKALGNKDPWTAIHLQPANDPLSCCVAKDQGHSNGEHKTHIFPSPLGSLLIEMG